MKEKLEVLTSIYDYILKAENQIIDISNLIRDGQGYKNITDFIEAITYIWQTFDITKDIHGINMNEYNINELVKDIMDGLENGDYNLIADIFEYEFYPMLRNWHEILEEVL